MDFDISEVVGKRWLVREEELDDEQYKIRMLGKGNYLIEGCAGSGKTVLALQKAKEIQDSNSGTYLVVLYTHSLKSFIKDGITQLNLDPDNVCNFHKLKKLGYEEVDYIIVDEIQDFTEVELNELLSFAKMGFIFFGDDAQQLYIDRKSLKLHEIRTIAKLDNEAHKKLVKNYRLPKSIAKMAAAVVNDETLVARCVKEDGDKPLVVKAPTLEEEIKYIKYIIEEEGLSDVGILVDSNEKIKDILRIFEKLNFQVEAKYKDNEQIVENLDFYSEKPKLMTYHSSKGLQFENVFLPSCEVDYKKYSMEKAIYVALTRASQNLTITYSGVLTPFISKINNASSKIFIERQI